MRIIANVQVEQVNKIATVNVKVVINRFKPQGHQLLFFKIPEAEE